MRKAKQHFSAWNSSSDGQHRLTDEEILRLHEVILGMYKDVKEVCDRYKIRLIAAGGTTLVAVRHKGFIPWDDDMDLFMLRNEYERFKKIFRDELGDRYYLLGPGSPDGVNCFLPRIMKKGTTLLNMIDEKSPYPKGIYIDINILEYAPENRFRFCIKAAVSDVLRFISYSVYWNQYKSESLEWFMIHSTGKRYYKVRILLGKLFSFLSAEKWFIIFDSYVQNKKTSVLTVPSGCKKYKNERLKWEKVFPLRETVFEDTNIYVVNDAKAYLTNLYGNYMEIPKNKEHHLCLAMDFGEELK